MLSETCKNLVLVMNCILLGALVGCGPGSVVWAG